jgi:hypothetical protein
MTRFLLCDQLSSRSSRKFRRDGITTLIRPAEIIRDLQRVQMLATLRAADSRSRDCGNDGGFYFVINYLAGHPGNFVAVK